MRLFQSRDRLQQFAIGEIDDADTVVAQFGHEQPLPFQIDRHVVDTAGDIAERNFRFDLERRRFRRLGNRITAYTRQHLGGEE